MIKRFSSRRKNLDTSFINKRLSDAVSYGRIAGDFRSSMLEVAGEKLEEMDGRVYVYNMRYRGSVEDRVHELLSDRLEDIYNFFGQIPDVLEDVWIDVANGEIENAKKLIASVKPKHPFDERYNQITEIDWDSCSNVLNADEKRKILLNEW